MLKPVIFTDSGTPREILLVNKRQVDLHDLKELRDLSEKRREAKAKEIRIGAKLLQKKRFPKKRKCQDWMWATVFLVAMLAFLGFIMYVSKMDTSLNDDSDFTGRQTVDHWDQQDGKYLHSGKDGRHAGKLDIFLLAFKHHLIGIGSALAALMVAFLFLQAVRVYPRPVLYCFLYLTPIIFTALGLVVAVLAWQMDPLKFYTLLLTGGVIVLIAVMHAVCIRLWHAHIDFTLEIVEMVADISYEAPRLLALSLLGALLFTILLVVILLSWSVVVSKHEKDFANQNKSEIASVNLACVLLLLWGSSVIDKLCHMAYCGAFSRWYFSLEGLMLLDSLHVAATTSFGSVCFGALVAVLVKTLYQVVRPAQKMAGDWNAMSAVIGCAIDMIVVCTGDVVEYFDDWTYTQCAIRGTSFCSSARSTYAVIACNGLPTVIAELMLDFVLQHGSIMCGIIGFSLPIANGVANKTFYHRPFHFQSSVHQIDIVNCLTGLIGGFIGGGIILRIFWSGSKAVLLCWAENPIPLHKEHDFEDLHTELTAKIRDAEMTW